MRSRVALLLPGRPANRIARGITMARHAEMLITVYGGYGSASVKVNLLWVDWQTRVNITTRCGVQL